MGSFVQFKKVSKTYHMGEVDIEALRDVNFVIEKGEFCVIVGASGAGKTTILNILGGMDSLSAGQVLLDGTDISAFGKKQLTAYRRRYWICLSVLQPGAEPDGTEKCRAGGSDLQKSDGCRHGS